MIVRLQTILTFALGVGRSKDNYSKTLKLIYKLPNVKTTICSCSEKKRTWVTRKKTSGKLPKTNFPWKINWSRLRKNICYSFSRLKFEFFANPFVPDTPKVCWCFQVVEKGYIGNKWIKVNSLNLAPGILLVFYSWWTYFLVQISFTCTFIFK